MQWNCSGGGVVVFGRCGLSWACAADTASVAAHSAQTRAFAIPGFFIVLSRTQSGSTLVYSSEFDACSEYGSPVRAPHAYTPSATAAASTESHGAAMRRAPPKVPSHDSTSITA